MRIHVDVKVPEPRGFATYWQAGHLDDLDVVEMFAGRKMPQLILLDVALGSSIVAQLPQELSFAAIRFGFQRRFNDLNMGEPLNMLGPAGFVRLVSK